MITTTQKYDIEYSVTKQDDDTYLVTKKYDGLQLPFDLRRDIVDHSEVVRYDFEGLLQLAVALIADCVNDECALHYYPKIIPYMLPPDNEPMAMHFSEVAVRMWVESAIQSELEQLGDMDAFIEYASKFLESDDSPPELF